MTAVIEPELLPSVVHISRISWDVYEKLLHAIGEGNLRLTYDNGELEIMSPLPEHEHIKSLIGRFVEALGEELDVPVRSLGSTTFKRKSLLKGLEPDECFYIKNEKLIRGKKQIDLKRDPPPDLVVEVDLSYSTLDKRAIYAVMRVPEIWSYGRGRLECLHLRRGKYEKQEFSSAFPRLRPTAVVPFLKLLDELDDSTIGRRWREWVRKNLA
jgi:Uma2 family endonuclease